MRSAAVETVLRLSARIEILPIVHANGDMAQEVRETLIARHYDCLAVPLPESVSQAVEAAIGDLPTVSVVVLREDPDEDAKGINSSAEETRTPPSPIASFVPIDPCQGVIMGIRVAMGEGIQRAYIDRDVRTYEPDPITVPDPYMLKTVSVAAYAAAALPSAARPAPGSQREARIAWMAFRLHELELDYEAILGLCPIQDWPYVREAYLERSSYRTPELPAQSPETYKVSAGSLYFVLGELPFITSLYEKRRAELRSDRYLSIDGVKELLLETRARWMSEKKTSTPGGDWITLQLLQIFLRYVRNLALLDRRLTPDLYTLATAAKQIGGDEFAVTLIETAKDYIYPKDEGETWSPRAPGKASDSEGAGWQGAIYGSITFGIGQAEFPDGTISRMKSRLPGPAQTWRTLQLKPKPTPVRRRDWGQRWNPQRQCSWPPEDSRIESFNLHVRDQAKALIGADLARTEKFTTSVKDGIDVRETLRHWHEREIYVKDIPPARGSIEVVVFLFDMPADPEKYSWQATWFAEHEEESTLSFFATPFRESLIGPGIGQSIYGGAMFLFPPRPIPDIWTDRRLAVGSLEERLLAGALLHSQERHVAVISPIRPPARWRLMARRYRKQLVSIPLSRFSRQTVDRLRRFHVLNGHEVRSYAAKFIQGI
jgi:hypothetical protein